MKAAAAAAKASTSSIPIVFVSGTDPVAAGFVKSLSRPDANLTGVHLLTILLSAKRQELLHELIPSAAVVAMLVNPSSLQNRFELPEVEAAAACAQTAGGRTCGPSVKFGAGTVTGAKD